MQNTGNKSYNPTEGSICEKNLQKYVRELELLSRFSIDLHNSETVDEIYEILGREIYQCTKESYVILSSFDSDKKTITIKKYFGFQKNLDSVLDLLGKDPKHMEFSSTDMTEEEKRIYTTCKIEIIPDGTYSLLMRNFPRPICTALDKLLGIKRVYCIGFGKKGDPKGGIMILAKYQNELIYKNAIESMVNQASFVIDKKIAEELLKEREEKYRELVENANSIIAKFDQDGIVLSMNEYGLKLFGYKKEELIGKDWQDVGIPTVESTGKRLDNLVPTIYENLAEYVSFTHENIKRNGERVWVCWTNKPVYDENGNAKGILSVGTDVTDKIKAEKALKDSEEKYRTLFEDSKNPIWTTSREGIILDANQATADLLGYSKDELIGLDVHSLYVDPKYRKIFQDEIEEKGFVKNFQSQWKTKDGRQLDLLFDFTLWKDNDEKIIGYRGIGEDVTLIIRSQKQLEENLEYFAHLVDYIRNPLTIICGFTQVEIENEKTKKRFMRQIARIEDIIKQLDQGWMDTEDTKRFLKKYM